MPTIQTDDGHSLFVRDWGEGEPVVFCAAWALSSVAWQYQMMSVVEAGRRAVAYDRRGHGRSDDPGRGYDYDTLAQDLRRVIEELDLQDVTLVAHSMGSGDAVRYLARHGSERVASLVLLAPAMPYLLKTADNDLGVDGQFFAERRDEWRRDFGQWVLKNEGPYFGDGLPGCQVSSLMRDWTKADMLSTSLHAVIEFQRSAVETDFREELSVLSVPTLVIQGDADTSAPLPLTGKRTAELIPNCRLVIYENAPHGLYLTHRERINNDLLAFIEDQAALLKV
jgi:non-heme chloroperoxidase